MQSCVPLGPGKFHVVVLVLFSGLSPEVNATVSSFIWSTNYTQSMREGFVGAFPILLNRSLATFVLNNSYFIASVFLANVWNTFQSADKKSQEKNLIYRSNQFDKFSVLTEDLMGSWFWPISINVASSSQKLDWLAQESCLSIKHYCYN